jgi:hypothetical protein
MASQYYPPQVIPISIYGLISAELGLVWAFAWSPAWRAGNIWECIFGFVGMPIDATLLISSAGLLMLLPWARKWMIWWAIAATIYATLYLPVSLYAPIDIKAMLPAEMQNQVSELDSNTKDMIVLVVQLVDWIGWLSTLSLSLWALWALRRPTVLQFYEGSKAVPAPPLPPSYATTPVPNLPPPRRPY